MGGTRDVIGNAGNKCTYGKGGIGIGLVGERSG